MKSFLCVLVLSFVGGLVAELSPDVKQMIHGIQVKCMAENGVAEAVLKEAQKTWVLPSDDNFKCFVKCNFANMGLVNADGALLGDAALEHIPQEIKDLGVKKVMDACSGEKGANPCDTSYKTLLCFAKTSKEIGAVFA